MGDPLVDLQLVNGLQIFNTLDLTVTDQRVEVFVLNHPRVEKLSEYNHRHLLGVRHTVLHLRQDNVCELDAVLRAGAHLGLNNIFHDIPDYHDLFVSRQLVKDLGSANK